MLGDAVAIVQTLGGGRNSRVYLVSDRDSRRYVIKHYFRSLTDTRDRLQTEFSGLRFLWGKGVRSVPQPLAMDPSYGLAAYQFVDGNSIHPFDVTAEDIDAACAFLACLRGLRDSEQGRGLPAASEACFSTHAILSNIESRFQRLWTLRQRDLMHANLKLFLRQEFVPAMQEIRLWCASRLRVMGRSCRDELSEHEKTLSPSDFGFHNALKQRDGRLIFVDFEYFGWDDPAKMMVDFVLHPAMPLKANHRARFVTNLLHEFADDSTLPARVELVYPLFALKWCLILLNEFVPDYCNRRRFAIASHGHIRSNLQEQLSKARCMLQRTLSHYERFPYTSYPS